MSRVQFEQLYRQHAGAVLAYARRRTTAEAANDVVAEVFLIAWRRIDEVPGEPLPWLLGCARRVLANQRRGEQRGAAVRDRIRRERSIAVHWPQDDEVPLAVRALWSLKARDQELLMLIAWDGLTRGEAARVLGISTATLAVRLHRARLRLARARATTGDADALRDRSVAMEDT